MQIPAAEMRARYCRESTPDRRNMRIMSYLIALLLALVVAAAPAQTATPANVKNLIIAKHK